MTVTEEDILRRANEVFSAMEKRSTLEEMQMIRKAFDFAYTCLLYTSPSPRDS